MRPTHVVLLLVKELLYSENNTEGERYICYGLNEAELANAITDEECAAASCAVLAKMAKMQRWPPAYLINAARELGIVHPYCRPTEPEYIAFRDKWLDELIAEEAAK